MQNLVVPLLVDQHLVMDLMLLETEMNQLLVHLNHILDDGCGFCIFHLIYLYLCFLHVLIYFCVSFQFVFWSHL
jgi:hypothetical protein